MSEYYVKLSVSTYIERKPDPDDDCATQRLLPTYFQKIKPKGENNI